MAYLPWSYRNLYTCAIPGVTGFLVWIRDIASEQAAQKLGEVAERLTRSLDEAKRESAELKGKLEEMERMINQAVYIA